MSELTHAEATELAGLYVLDALTPDERAEVDAHLASCAEAHDEFAAVGGVVPALASLAEPMGAPASLKNKVMADYRAGAGAAVWTPAPAAAARAPGRASWVGWAAAAMAVLLIAVVAGWGYVAQSRADREAHRSQMIAQAIDLMAQPDSKVALLSGTGSSIGAASVHGFAALSPSGSGYLVMVGLSSAPAGQTIQAWTISNGSATSAGLMSVDADGYALITLPGAATADAIALTIEPAGGSDQPTSDPFAVGEVRSNSSAS
jgi:anti-sigma-K factor RskA